MANQPRRSRRDGRLISPTAADGWPRGITCDGGFRLTGTMLGFPGCRRSGIVFQPSMDTRPPRRGGRIICTPETAAAMGPAARGIDALELELERSILLGRMELTLLPSGIGPGAAMLSIGLGSRRIVYLAGLRTGAPLFSPEVSTPRCDLLLVDFAAGERRPPSPKTSADRLRRWYNDARSGHMAPAVICDSNLAAMDAVRALSTFDTTFHAARPLFEMIRRSGTGVHRPSNLQRLNQGWPTSGVVIHRADLWPSRPHAQDSSIPVASVGPGKAVPTWAQAAFRFGDNEDTAGLARFVADTGATEVALGPRCDPRTEKALLDTSVTVHRVKSPTQIALPF